MSSVTKHFSCGASGGGRGGRKMAPPGKGWSGDGWRGGGRKEEEEEEEEEEEVGEWQEGLVGTIVFSWRWRWIRCALT